MAKYRLQARLEFNGSVLVEADSPEEAERKFDAKDFDFSIHQFEMVGWDSIGEAEEEEV